MGSGHNHACAPAQTQLRHTHPHFSSTSEKHSLTHERRTTYNGGPEEFQETPLNDLLKQIEAGTMKVQVGKVFHLDEIVEAHRTMEENRAGGKIVVLT